MLVIGAHADHIFQHSERLGNFVLASKRFVQGRVGHPPVQQEVDVANPSGAVSPQGSCGVNRALAASKSGLKLASPR